MMLGFYQFRPRIYWYIIYIDSIYQPDSIKHLIISNIKGQIYEKHAKKHNPQTQKTPSDIQIPPGLQTLFCRRRSRIPGIDHIKCPDTSDFSLQH